MGGGEQASQMALNAMKAGSTTTITYYVVTEEVFGTLETNEKVQSQWKFFERRQHKRRRCYIKDLN